MTGAVLQDAPTLSNHDATAAGASGVDWGQRGHSHNASGYGSWPYILSIELIDDNIVEYGSDMINVEFGNTDDYTDVDIINDSAASYAELHVTLTDPALNIDPTTADIWIFDLASADDANYAIFANNGTNTAMTQAQLGDMQCEDNCRLYNSSGTA